MVGAEHQQVGFQAAALQQNFLHRPAGAQQQLGSRQGAGGQARRQLLAGARFGRGLLAVEHMQQGQARAVLVCQLGGARQGQVGLRAEVVGDEDVLKHGGLTRRD
ncbi:hypothetical protein D3C78_1693380 [compost metagenome]